MQLKLLQKISYYYLRLIPFLVAVPAFAIGHISYKVYLPIWLINAVIMIIAISKLGLNILKNNDIDKKQLAIISILLILPWIFISIFFGMGPPPGIPSHWIERSTEQQTRYTILIVSSVLIALGFGGLRAKLNKKGEDFYSTVGFTAIMIAVPLYIIYMTLLHSFDFEAFKIMSNSGKLPDWYIAIEKQYALISVVEASLIYSATALFAASLGFTKMFNTIASRYYVIISIIAALLVMLLPLYGNLVAFLGIFPLVIPAIPFIMPYLIGVNLLKRLGTDQHLL